MRMLSERKWFVTKRNKRKTKIYKKKKTLFYPRLIFYERERERKRERKREKKLMFKKKKRKFHGRERERERKK